MADVTVPDRKELIGALQNLYKHIDDIVSANGIVCATRSAAQAYSDDDKYLLKKMMPSKVSDPTSAHALALSVLEEKLLGIYDAFDRVREAVGVKWPLLGDEPTE